ncbi:MAG: regulatory protein RecX [Mobilicoccus sp.]|nr:regulatory protein RecX [Mobilicoccus sp.]
MSDPRLERARAALAEAELAASAAGLAAGAAAAGAASPPDHGDASDEHAAARQIVLRQLAAGPRSRAQLESKLAAKEIDPDVAADVLDRFAQVGLVDDEEFAGMLVRSQQANRGLSRRGLAHELRKKGIADDVAADALAEVDASSERARAEDLVASRLRRLHGLPREVQMRRLAGFLARKGYPGEMSFTVIRQALDNADEHARD